MYSTEIHKTLKDNEMSGITVVGWRDRSVREQILLVPGAAYVLDSEMGYSVAVVKTTKDESLNALKSLLPDYHIYHNGIDCGRSPYGLMDR